MSVLQDLSISKGERDEKANVLLAARIAATKDKKAVAELALNLFNKNRKVRNDCIKALYEIGKIDPLLIQPESETYRRLLQHKDNRMKWGAMSALHAISTVDPAAIYRMLPDIMEAA